MRRLAVGAIGTSVSGTVCGQCGKRPKTVSAALLKGLTAETIGLAVKIYRAIPAIGLKFAVRAAKFSLHCH